MTHSPQRRSAFAKMQCSVADCFDWSVLVKCITGLTEPQSVKWCGYWVQQKHKPVVAEWVRPVNRTHTVKTQVLWDDFEAGHAGAFSFRPLVIEEFAACRGYTARETHAHKQMCVEQGQV